MDKEKLRKLLGEFGNVSAELERMFGKVYMDNPDTTTNGVPQGLEDLGGRSIGDLLERAIEQAPEKNCEWH